MAVVMVSSSTIIFLSAICINLIAPAIASSPKFLGYNCSDKEGNYTGGSTYQKNLYHLLSSLNSSSTGIDNGFYNLYYGENPDKVYAIALCRGDVKPDFCHNCPDISKYILLIHRCRIQKEAIAWHDECMLRYSSRNIFSTMQATPEYSTGSAYNVSNDAKVEFNNTLFALLEKLRDAAAAGGSLRKFAVGNAAAPKFQTINALVQCTPDLSQQDCSQCLNEAIDNFRICCAGRQGGGILRPSCSFRYENDSFYNNTAVQISPPPPSLTPPQLPLPPPAAAAAAAGQRTNKFQTEPILVVAPVALVVLAIDIYINLKVRKLREKPVQSNSTKRTSSSVVAPTVPLSSKFCWHVFLSFRGIDTCKNFIDHLYSSLARVGIRTFREDEELPRGESISTQLLNTIHGSRISIVVFSKDYASSTWCLDELVKIVDCRKIVGHTLLPIFYHIDPSDVRRQTGTFEEAFVKHEERFQTNMGRVQRWREALTKAASCSGLDLESTTNGYESRFIDKIVEKVVHMVNAPADQNVANI